MYYFVISGKGPDENVHNPNKLTKTLRLTKQPILMTLILKSLDVKMPILTQVFKEVTTACLSNIVKHLQILPYEIVLLPNVIVIL